MTFNKNDVFDALGSGGYTGQINEREKKFLEFKGYSGQVNGAWYKYLKAQGYTGTLTDKFHAWAAAGYPIV